MPSKKSTKHLQVPQLTSIPSLERYVKSHGELGCRIFVPIVGCKQVKVSFTLPDGSSRVQSLPDGDVLLTILPEAVKDASPGVYLTKLEEVQ